ncbi:uncharacterized protein LOC113227748 isoform X2 [Hyposmocoma kahamanoa]|uniref:uncharacterized protein LOC113227748 isoform X2 n=1 Tax=Hyposmocoma kahamanoa TaxID=1477025 RepID=UPI000E6DA567|nr:uncharacterized protein LOC113227748 isoform X2 [Hyposmocoma kahamanoa]
MWRVSLLVILAAVAATTGARRNVRRTMPMLATDRAPSPVSAQQLYDRLFSLYRGRTADSSASHRALTPFPYELTLGGGVSGVNVTTLPVLVLPLPVLVGLPSANNGECNAHANRSEAQTGAQEHDDDYRYDLDTRYGGAGGTPPVDNLPAVAVTSEQLVEHFRAQTSLAPHLPPAVIDELVPRVGASFEYGVSGGSRPPQEPRPFAPRVYLPPSPSPRTPAAPPPQPRFRRSTMLRATLSVPRADYAEPYTAWWDAATGAARVDFHGGATSTVRTMLPDGRVQRVEMRLDRTGAADVRRCGFADPSPVSSEDRALPALPDIELFTFAEYRAEGEIWRLELKGGAGELGAARGEALTYHHELQLRRDDAGEAIPVRYSVVVDSSVLGAGCDSYEHRYEEVRAQEVDPAIFSADLDLQCDVRERVDPQDAEQMARLEPLREFTMQRRDPRYDDGLQRFVREFERQYKDDTEEAVRKNLFVQHSRFVNSCNREGATFEVEVNFLGDRLDVELDVLLGTQFSDADDGAGDDAAPTSRKAQDGAQELPREFDWRPRGAVSPVRYQGSCSSCWAFAVVGSVEGALFIRTRSLVPLSVQCLVDCAHSHGANGCRGTWPKHAYDYVRDRGLPHYDEYTAYSERVLPCRAPPVPPVTHISGHVNVQPGDLDALKVAIRRHAPTVVVVDAKPKSFMFYKKGVLKDERCVKGPKKKLNHAVLAVGWGEQRGEPHFILKNTYSAAWGDGGYIRLHGPSNTCGVLSVPSYARLRRRDVDRPPSGAGAAADLDYSDEEDRR